MTIKETYVLVKKTKGSKILVDNLKKENKKEFSCNSCLKCRKGENECDQCGRCGSTGVGGTEISIKVSIRDGHRVEVHTETIFEQGVKTVIISTFKDGKLVEKTENGRDILNVVDKDVVEKESLNFLIYLP